MSTPLASAARRICGSIAISAALILPVLGSDAVAAADDAGNQVVFVLDASGSMGARIDGRPKMDIAKETLAGLISDLPAGVRVGLVAYGHRRKDDCTDIETLAPLGPLDRPGLIAKVKALGHQGQTPISESVRQVADGLKGLPGETTVVLVSDGQETCGGDPCALVKSLKASGVRFVMHVIGFAVGDKERRQLQCIADAGGGSYLSAKNAKELSAAGHKALAKSEETVGRLTLKAQRNGKPVDAWYEIRPAGAPADQDPMAANPIGDQGDSVKLLPGTYDVRIRDTQDVGSPVASFPGVQIVQGKTEQRVADFSGANLKLKAQRNGQPVAAWFDIYTAGAGEGEQPVASNPIGEAGETVKLPAGGYDVKIRDNEDVGNPVQTFAALKLGPGETVEKVADFSGGTLQMKALRNGQPLSAWYSVYAAGASHANGDEPVASNPLGEDGAKVSLPPGTYDLEILDPQDADQPSKRISGIRIVAGQTTSQVAEFSGGALHIKATKGGQPAAGWYAVYEAGAASDGGDAEPIAQNPLGEEGETVSLVPGVYDLKIRYSGEEGERFAEFPRIEIQAGQTVDETGAF